MPVGQARDLLELRGPPAQWRREDDLGHALPQCEKFVEPPRADEVRFVSRPRARSRLAAPVRALRRLRGWRSGPTSITVVLVFVGAALRFEGLGGSALSFDESFTAMVGRLPIRAVFPFLRVADSHPPLDYLL